MDSSDNLICLSDSGVGPALSTSLINPVKSSDVDILGIGVKSTAESKTDVEAGLALSTSLTDPVKSMDLDIFGIGFTSTAECKTKGSCVEAGLSLSTSLNDPVDIFGIRDSSPSNTAESKTEGSKTAAAGTDLLIDFSDEVEVPQHTGFMLQAEIDDTFGIFSKAQEQRSSEKANAGKRIVKICDEEIEDEAAKLVRSFTSGRKSDGVKVKNKQEEKEKMGMDDCDDNNKKCNPNDSNGSVDSDHPTIVDPEEALSPGLVVPEKEEDGIMEQTKMDDTTTSSNLSGGSDSDYLDIRNLSSFSIPDGDENMDESKFIEEIKKENMSTAIATKAIVTKIKLEMMQDDVDVEEEDNMYLARANCRSNRLSGRCDLLSEISRPSVTTSSVSRLSSTSVTSSTSTTSRLSTRSRASSSSSGFGDVPVATSSFMHPPGGTEAPDKPSTRTRFRISSNFGSPIRASYPVSKYFMPTPNAKTPSTAASKSRVDFRDKLSESLYSPSRTRVMLITGDSQRSPSRVPVRKSISAETLHFEYNSPVRDARRHVKFSTPSAGNRPSTRHSFSSQPRAPNHPNLFGDDFSDDIGTGDHDATLTDRARAAFMEPRLGRLSYATTASNSSINTLSPPTSSVYTRDLSVVTRGFSGINLCESPNKGIAKATAVIAPTAKPKPIITSTAEKGGLIMPSKLKPGVGTAAAGGSLRPIAASSPKTAPSPHRPNRTFQTTPSRTKYGNNVRSSGYGAQQNLNSTFGATQQPLKSPNKTVAAIKPPAIPKSMKTGVPSLNSKLDMISRGGGVATTKTGVSALKPIGKMGQTGLRRPTIPGTTSTSTAVGNKENKLRPTTSLGSRIAMSRQGPRQ